MQLTNTYTGRWLFLFMLLIASIAHGDNTPTDTLRDQVRQRDQVILELLERVEALEQQVGITPAPSKSTAEKKPATTMTHQPQDHAPGLVVADEAMAERALERSLTRAGALLLSPGIVEVEPRLSYSRQEDGAPGFVSSGSGVVASQTELNSDNLVASVNLRVGLPGDAQLEIGLPYHWRRTETVTRVGFLPVSSDTQSGAGNGDVQLTLAKTLWHEDADEPSVIGRLSWDTDSGKQSDNNVSLGGGYQDVQGSLTFISRQDPVVFVTSVTYQHSAEKESIQPGDLVSASFGSYLALNPQTSMSFSLALAQQKETRLSGDPLPGSDRMIANLVIAGSSLIARGTLLNLSLGIGLTRDASDFSLTASLPVRF